jgi:AcrR family transcriptional regulator
MPPKVKITKTDIIETALSLCRKHGEEAINARSVAAALDCSTQPVFTNFATMEELKAATVSAAYELYLGFLQREKTSGRYPEYKSFGMAYIRFAQDEKELFKLLFMRDRTNEELAFSPDFDESVKMIMKANNVSEETAKLMHLEMWTCVHGIGTMLATSFLSLDRELISDMLTDVYQGLRARHLPKEDK